MRAARNGARLAAGCRRVAVGAGLLTLVACATVPPRHAGDMAQSLDVMARELHALKAEIARRDEADRVREALFRDYVASTQHHARSENSRLIASLFDIGLSPADAFGALAVPGLAAGGVDRSLGLEGGEEGSATAVLPFGDHADDDAGDDALAGEAGGEGGEGGAAGDVSAAPPSFLHGGEGEGAATLLALNDGLRAFVAAIPATLPVREERVSSGFGVRRHPISRRLGAHEGIDFVPVAGREVLAAGDGVVRFAGRGGGYGKLVVVEHAFGFETRYAHLSRIAVVPGQRVSPSDAIGIMGSTGYSTGVHLHFEIRFRGRALDPAKVLALAREPRLLAARD